MYMESPKGSDSLRPRHERRLSREGVDLKSSTDSPSRPENLGRIATGPSPHLRHGGSSNSETPRRVSRQGAGSDRSTDQSPLHPHHQSRVKSSGVSSPSWERKGSSASEGNHVLAPATPTRSRLSSVTRGDDTPDDSPAVPKFGDWDDNDPQAAEGYTQIFKMVRKEKQSGTGKVPTSANEGSYSNGQKQYGKESAKKCGCFPWGRK